MSQVWLPKKSTKAQDLSSVEKYGRIVEVFKKSPNPLDVDGNSKVVQDEVMPLTFKDDLVLSAGPTVLILVVVTQFLKRYGECRLLVWKHSRSEFVVRTLSLKEMR